jgi:hypothetical protein
VWRRGWDSNHINPHRISNLQILQWRRCRECQRCRGTLPDITRRKRRRRYCVRVCTPTSLGIGADCSSRTRPRRARGPIRAAKSLATQRVGVFPSPGRADCTARADAPPRIVPPSSSWAAGALFGRTVPPAADLRRSAPNPPDYPLIKAVEHGHANPGDRPLPACLAVAHAVADCTPSWIMSCTATMTVEIRTFVSRAIAPLFGGPTPDCRLGARGVALRSQFYSTALLATNAGFARDAR